MELSKEQCYTRAKEICKQNDVFNDLVEGFQKWYYNFALTHNKDCTYTDYETGEVDPQDVDLIHTWWDECCNAYDNYSNDWRSPFNNNVYS